MDSRMENILKSKMEEYENTLGKNACKSKEAIREEKISDDIRTAFARDTDRILHTQAFTRYLDKTQVYTNEENDNISKRMTHVQFVSKASRTIARALSLNEDLCEAISLGHDIGHTPFGHEGEYILNEISKERLGYSFAHNLNSVRMLRNIENHGNGCNLSLQVLDGIMCHNGEMVKKEYYPMKKNLKDFLDEYEKCLYDEKYIKNIRPMTLEGCVVRISDIIGYIGKDIEDAIRIGKLNVSEIPEDIKEGLGTTNHDIMNNIILDVICQSYGKDYISISEKMYNLITKLKKFNYEKIYIKANNKEELQLYKKMFNTLFEIYVDKINKKEYECEIYTDFLNDMNDKYKNEENVYQIVIDYLSGMTDKYIIDKYGKYVKE